MRAPGTASRLETLLSGLFMRELLGIRPLAPRSGAARLNPSFGIGLQCVLRKFKSQLIASRMVPLLVIRPVLGNQVAPSM